MASRSGVQSQQLHCQLMQPENHKVSQQQKGRHHAIPVMASLWRLRQQDCRVSGQPETHKTLKVRKCSCRTGEAGRLCQLLSYDLLTSQSPSLTLLYDMEGRANSVRYALSAGSGSPIARMQSWRMKKLVLSSGFPVCVLFV